MSMKVGDDGRLTIAPQDNGFLLVVLHDQGYAQTTREELAANPEIKLKAWARVEGVVREGGKPVSGLLLVAHENDRRDSRWGFLNHDDQTTTDAAGRFAFPKLKPGAWYITGAHGRKEYGRMTLAPGQTVTMTLGSEKD